MAVHLSSVELVTGTVYHIASIENPPSLTAQTPPPKKPIHEWAHVGTRTRFG